MLSYERHNKILEALGREGNVSTVALAQMFDVSRETVRRDLLELAGRGILQRVHGGAIVNEQDAHPEPTFQERLGTNAEVKRAIGIVATKLIPKESTIFVDAGTTTLLFAEEIARVGSIHIITNSLEIAKLTSQSNDCDTLLLGGRPHTDVPATYGELTLSEIERFRADYAVIAPVGVHPDRGASDYELHEAEVARAMMRRSRQNIILCAAEKIGVDSRVTICQLDEIDHFVTDHNPGNIIHLDRGRVHLAVNG